MLMRFRSTSNDGANIFKIAVIEDPSAQVFTSVLFNLICTLSNRTLLLFCCFYKPLMSINLLSHAWDYWVNESLNLMKTG